MKKQDFLIADKLKKELSSNINLLDLRVFGSRAIETNDEYSDMDVYIQVETVTKEIKEKISDIAWKIGYDNNIVISTLIYTREEVVNSPIRSSPIIKNIYQYGIVI
ncbi:MAG: nucleotidyltransferase domain-containing protein [Spirochaetota bacterium]